MCLSFEGLDNHRECRTEEHDLAVLGVECEKLLNDDGEFG